jgi:hypothetical protein
MPPGVSPACDLSPTRQSSSNDKGTLWQRHTMSDWHRNTNPEDSAFITHGQLMEERPYLKVKQKKMKDPSSPLNHHLKAYATQSAIFSNRLMTAELQPIPIITDYRRRPPRHLDPRIRGWDLNSTMWWPSTLGPANIQAGQEDEAKDFEKKAMMKARTESALRRESLSATPRTPPRKSTMLRQSSKEPLRTPSPISRASISASSNSGAVPRRRKSSKVQTKSRDEPPPADLLPEYVMKRGISMRYTKWVDEHGKPPEAPHLPFLTLDGDFRGADRPYNVQVGSPVRPSGQCLLDHTVP